MPGVAQNQASGYTARYRLATRNTDMVNDVNLQRGYDVDNFCDNFHSVNFMYLTKNVNKLLAMKLAMVSGSQAILTRSLKLVGPTTYDIAGV